MTPRDRWIAALTMQPADRLPFWPKLDAAYPPAQAAPFGTMSVDAIHDWIGSDKHAWIPDCLKDIRRRTASEISTEGRLRTTTFSTPRGSARLVTRFDAASQSWHPVSFPVRNVDDARLMTEWFLDSDWAADGDQLEKAKTAAKEIGHGALTANGIGESPLMYWVEWLAGVENAHLMLADHASIVEELFDAIHRSLLRRTELLCEHSPADVLYLVENTSTTLISPQQYRRHCLKHITQYGEIARGCGRLVVLHMCGHIKALLPDLAQLPVAGFEAFTSPTLGNATLLDGRTACPDKCLIGGTNAILWLRPAREIIAQIEHDLASLPHHRGIVVTSAGVMPPFCRPETIKTVCDWVKRYDANMR